MVEIVVVMAMVEMVVEAEMLAKDRTCEGSINFHLLSRHLT